MKLPYQSVKQEQRIITGYYWLLLLVIMIYKMSTANHCVLPVCDDASRVIGYGSFEREYCLHLQESEDLLILEDEDGSDYFVTQCQILREGKL